MFSRPRVRSLLALSSPLLNPLKLEMGVVMPNNQNHLGGVFRVQQEGNGIHPQEAQEHRGGGWIPSSTYWTLKTQPR
jgi:hypothetical protein